ncbi:hypothetical protein ACFSSC_06670 [Corynebacterium mendelii]|uniref:DUF306 domain-containing protein n=1 Tax=Corynebacterium mendelii TaxID=2765362 RepID=A0A939E3G2_9CORY|nr:hypothetical protein [Corynebacterium mendelii]MBN9644986.1 hypothetical protein [Corynebacterium mendelii]
MANPLVAFLAAATAFSSGMSTTIDTALPAGASFSSFGDFTGHVQSPLPQGAQRIADQNRIKNLMQGTLTAVSSKKVTIVTAPEPTATGTLPVTGSDGCNPYSAQLVVTNQGAIVLGNARRDERGCDSPVDDEFWKVFSGQTIMYLANNNIIYLTDGVDGIAFRKTGA